jgi:hypothetical protein
MTPGIFLLPCHRSRFGARQKQSFDPLDLTVKRLVIERASGLPVGQVSCGLLNVLPMAADVPFQPGT